MVQTVLRREFLTACDSCGQRCGPAVESPERALQLARDQGWQAVTSYCAVGLFTTWLCPACQTRREQDRRNPS